ncbi:uncharacterized protein LOC34618688 [Cyclospora cayetanensis]|uniref:Uncharacterized protein LOC34618688 n=1 Tax=Cyclospora cayetanensis TaxID=88456 RepID=A0A6P6RZR0_9EIME|nr:uncharacterized protein LOC34618688 [Cyclospora cayetanensis]
MRMLWERRQASQAEGDAPPELLGALTAGNACWGPTAAQGGPINDLQTSNLGLSLEEHVETWKPLFFTSSEEFSADSLCVSPPPPTSAPGEVNDAVSVRSQRVDNEDNEILIPVSATFFLGCETCGSGNGQGLLSPPSDRASQMPPETSQEGSTELPLGLFTSVVRDGTGTQGAAREYSEFHKAQKGLVVAPKASAEEHGPLQSSRLIGSKGTRARDGDGSEQLCDAAAHGSSPAITPKPEWTTGAPPSAAVPAAPEDSQNCNTCGNHVSCVDCRCNDVHAVCKHQQGPLQHVNGSHTMLLLNDSRDYPFRHQEGLPTEEAGDLGTPTVGSLSMSSVVPKLLCDQLEQQRLDEEEVQTARELESEPAPTASEKDAPLFPQEKQQQKPPQPLEPTAAPRPAQPIAGAPIDLSTAVTVPSDAADATFVGVVVAQKSQASDGASSRASAQPTNQKQQEQQEKQQQGQRGCLSSSATVRAASRRALLDSLRFTFPLSGTAAAPAATEGSPTTAATPGNASSWKEGSVRQSFGPAVSSVRPGSRVPLSCQDAATTSAASATPAQTRTSFWGSGNLRGFGSASRALTVREVISEALRNRCSNGNREGVVAFRGGGTQSSQQPSWQTALCYSSRSYSSLDREALLFYLQLVSAFETHWVPVKPLLSLEPVLPPPATNDAVRPSPSLGAPGSVIVYLVAPCLIRAIRKVRLLPMQLQALAVQEISLCSSGPGYAGSLQQQQEEDHSEGLQKVLKAAQQHVKLPNPLKLHMQAAATTPLSKALLDSAVSGRPCASPSAPRTPETKPLESSGGGNRVIDVFLCCGGKDMLALDWLPFVSRYLHFCLSASVRRKQQAAVREGRLTFSEDAVFRTAAAAAQQQRVGAKGHEKAEVIAQVLARAASMHIGVAQVAEESSIPGLAASPAPSSSAADVANKDGASLVELEVPVLLKMDMAFVLLDYPGYGHNHGDVPTPEVRGLTASLRQLRAQSGGRCRFRTANIICKELIWMQRELQRRHSSSGGNSRISTSSSSSSTWASLTGRETSNRSSRSNSRSGSSSSEHEGGSTENGNGRSRRSNSPSGGTRQAATTVDSTDAVAASPVQQSFVSPLRAHRTPAATSPSVHPRASSATSTQRTTSLRSSVEEDWGDSTWGVESALSDLKPADTSFGGPLGSVSLGWELRAFFEELLDENDASWGQQQGHDEELEAPISFRGLALVATFTTTADCAAAFLQLPSPLNAVFRSLIEFIQDENTKWNNELAIRRFCTTLATGRSGLFKGAQLLIFHGTADRVVPCWMGARLFALAGESGIFHQKEHPEEQKKEAQLEPLSKHDGESAVHRSTGQGVTVSEGASAPLPASATTVAARDDFACIQEAGQMESPCAGLCMEAQEHLAGARTGSAFEQPRKDHAVTVHPGCEGGDAPPRVQTGSAYEGDFNAECVPTHAVVRLACDAAQDWLPSTDQRPAAATQAAARAEPSLRNPERGLLPAEDLLKSHSLRRHSLARDPRGLLTLQPHSSVAHSDTEACNSSGNSNSHACASLSLESQTGEVARIEGGSMQLSVRCQDTPAPSEVDEPKGGAVPSRALPRVSPSFRAPGSHRESASGPHGILHCPECLCSPHLEWGAPDLAADAVLSVACSSSSWVERITARFARPVNSKRRYSSDSMMKRLLESSDEGGPPDDAFTKTFKAVGPYNNLEPKGRGTLKRARAQSQEETVFNPCGSSLETVHTNLNRKWGSQ